MPKVSRERMKKDENKVIRELLKDSNQSVDSIANKCGFSRQKVWRIVKRLEENKTIWGYTAVVNDEKLGVSNYVALVKRSGAQPRLKEVVDKIITRDIEKEIADTKMRIVDSYYTNGIYDWVICFTAENIKQAKQFCDIVTRLYKKQIEDVQLLDVLFPMRKKGILNPSKDELKDFVE